MANKPKKKPLLYFFYEGDLHRKVHINRGADVIIAWNYPKGRTERYSYTLVKREGEKAFKTVEVAKMVNRTRKTIELAIIEGNVPRPQITYGIDENRKQYAFYWCEKDIMALHDYLKTVHYGRPRKDDLVTPLRLPTAAELRAQIRQGTVFYVQDADGEFVPTWKAEQF